MEGPGRCGIGCGCRGREGGCCAGVETGAWRGRRDRGRTAAWREVLLVGLSSGQGWSEGGFVEI